MSHKATNWLASLPPERLSNGEFRVLFHLCDCHNPSEGCFPSQAYLMKATSLSNAGLNKCLKSLEAARLIRRERTADQVTKRRKSTRYILGFEFSTTQEPTPLSGDGAISTLTPEPSPPEWRSHLHPGGDKPVKEPVKNRAGAHDAAVFWAEKIKSGKPVCASAIRPELARRMLDRGLVEAGDLRRRGITF